MNTENLTRPQRLALLLLQYAPRDQLVPLLGSLPVDDLWGAWMLAIPKPGSAPHQAVEEIEPEVEVQEPEPADEEPVAAPVRSRPLDLPLSWSIQGPPEQTDEQRRAQAWDFALAWLSKADYQRARAKHGLEPLSDAQYQQALEQAG